MSCKGKNLYILNRKNNENKKSKSKINFKNGSNNMQKNKRNYKYLKYSETYCVLKSMPKKI